MCKEKTLKKCKADKECRKCKAEDCTICPEFQNLGYGTCGEPKKIHNKSLHIQQSNIEWDQRLANLSGTEIPPERKRALACCKHLREVKKEYEKQNAVLPKLAKALVGKSRNKEERKGEKQPSVAEEKEREIKDIDRTP